MQTIYWAGKQNTDILNLCEDCIHTYSIQIQNRQGRTHPDGGHNIPKLDTDIELDDESDNMDTELESFVEGTCNKHIGFKKVVWEPRQRGSEKTNKESPSTGRRQGTVDEGREMIWWRGI